MLELVDDPTQLDAVLASLTQAAQTRIADTPSSGGMEVDPTTEGF